MSLRVGLKVPLNADCLSLLLLFASFARGAKHHARHGPAWAFGSSVPRLSKKSKQADKSRY